MGTFDELREGSQLGAQPVDRVKSQRSTKRPPPAFQCYASDWMSDEEYMMAPAVERGLLFSILNYCWVNGRVPADPMKLTRLLNLTPDEVKVVNCALLRKHMARCPGNDSHMYFPELDRQKAAMIDRQRKQVEGGRKGGESTQTKQKRSASTSGQPASSPSSLPSSSAQAPEMSGDEMSGDEMKRNPVYTGNDPTEHEEWLREYEGPSIVDRPGGAHSKIN